MLAAQPLHPQTRPQLVHTPHTYACTHARTFNCCLQGVREAYLLALKGVLVSSGLRLAPATLTKVGAALDVLRDSQGKRLKHCH